MSDPQNIPHIGPKPTDIPLDGLDDTQEVDPVDVRSNVYPIRNSSYS